VIDNFCEHNEVIKRNSLETRAVLEMAETVALENKIESDQTSDTLVTSSDPEHPANLIPDLCRNFYRLGWVGGVSVWHKP
jgi:hypothetical protein